MELVPVLEHVLLDGVAVDVQVHEEGFFFHLRYLVQQVLGRVHRRVEYLRGRLTKPAIQVDRCERAAVVSIYDAVGVEHRHEVEIEVVLQILNQQLLFVALRVQQALQQPVHDPAGLGFARVHARRNEDDVLCVGRAGITFEVEVLDAVSRKRLAQVEFAARLRLHVVAQHGVSVGHAVGEVKGVLTGRKLISETKAEQISATRQIVVHLVSYAGAAAHPLWQALFLVRLLLVAVEHQHTHALVVQRLALLQIQNVESNRALRRKRVFVEARYYLEVVPLRVSLGVDVVLQNQVVARRTALLRNCQVPRLKDRIKGQDILLRLCVIGLYDLVVVVVAGGCLCVLALEVRQKVALLLLDVPLLGKNQSVNVNFKTAYFGRLRLFRVFKV